MAEFLCVTNSEIDYRSKFIRLGERVYVTDPNETTTLHSELAQRDGIMDEINELVKTDAKSLDFGFLSAKGFGRGKEIVISGSTISIEVSRSTREEAREITGEIIEKMCPDFKVHIIR